MNTPILICTDLDRTLLPNGNQPESHGARENFARLVARPNVALAYVSGRHRELVMEAIAEYRIPLPDFVIGDVGTSIYSINDTQWLIWQSWLDEIAPDWCGLGREDLHALFDQLDPLRLQPPTKQNRFKLSYYAPPDINADQLLDEMAHRLRPHHIKASLIWSVDETVPVGLIDVLPQRATKLHAVRFLMSQAGFEIEHTVFAGDSGNDLPVLASPVPSVLVANATPEVRKEALALASKQNTLDTLYLAKGDFRGMNGNYSAGILEGLARFIPITATWWG
jgi:HAD superfamily hydrolase (TIGR01484 family)